MGSHARVNNTADSDVLITLTHKFPVTNAQKIITCPPVRAQLSTESALAPISLPSACETTQYSVLVASLVT